MILNTEHGPTGGDEVNVNVSPSTDFIENFGWPNASYGVSYDNLRYYQKSHKKNKPLHDYFRKQKKNIIDPFKLYD